MRRAFVLAVLAGTALSVCPGASNSSFSDGRRLWSTADAASRTAPGKAAPAAPARPLLVLTKSPKSGVVLERVDPLSLERLSPYVPVGEYHDAWSLSPDGSHLALGVSSGQSLLLPSSPLRGRIGIYIVDLQAMELVREVQTGIAAGALGWLAPSRLVAALLRGGTVLVDPLEGTILRRWHGFSSPDASARTPNGLVMVFGGSASTPRGTVIPRLAVADARGRFRRVVLERIHLAVHPRVYYADRPGLAVDSSRDRAFVFAAGAPAATVDLRTMRVSYHRLASEPSVSPTKRVLARDRRALWLGDGRVLVFGYDSLSRASHDSFASVPAGARLIDTATWKTRLLDPMADSAVSTAGMILAYRSRGQERDGLRMYTVDGRRVATLLDGEHVNDVVVAGGWAYVRTQNALYLLDVVSKRIVNTIVPRFELIGVIAGSS